MRRTARHVRVLFPCLSSPWTPHTYRTLPWQTNPRWGAMLALPSSPNNRHVQTGCMTIYAASVLRFRSTARARGSRRAGVRGDAHGGVVPARRDDRILRGRCRLSAIARSPVGPRCNRGSGRRAVFGIGDGRNPPDARTCARARSQTGGGVRRKTDHQLFRNDVIEASLSVPRQARAAAGYSLLNVCLSIATGAELVRLLEGAGSVVEIAE